MKFFPALVILSAATIATALSKPYTPAKGSAESTALIDPVRSILEKQINQEVIFVVDHLKVEGDWALFIGTPKTKAGGPIDYTGTIYEEEAKEADEITVGLLGKIGEHWIVIAHGFFTTDVWWYGLWEQYPGCPQSIFEQE